MLATVPAIVFWLAHIAKALAAAIAAALKHKR